MARCCFPLLLMLLGALPAAQRPEINNVSSASELEQSYRERRRELAADYRIQRARVYPTLPASYHHKAEQALTLTRSLLAERRVRRARELAEQAYRDYQYSDAAAALMHQRLRSLLGVGDLHNARRVLIDLWERHPDYDGISTALDEALLIAELVQQRAPAFNLAAAHPDEVIIEERIGDLSRTDPLFRFLAQHGDRHRVAPRAALGLARSLLLRGRSHRRMLVDARIAYDEFFERYPQSDLVFTALVEQAVSYLLAYRGDHYDVGVLITAAGIIQQAEFYAREDPRRLAIVDRFRSLIRRWHQERDLQVARWYSDRGEIPASRLYYGEVIERDNTAPIAATARRERAALPAPDNERLGTAGADAEISGTNGVGAGE